MNRISESTTVIVQSFISSKKQSDVNSVDTNYDRGFDMYFVKETLNKRKVTLEQFLKVKRFLRSLKERKVWSFSMNISKMLVL